jgi:hypothetical protein
MNLEILTLNVLELIDGLVMSWGVSKTVFLFFFSSFVIVDSVNFQ